MSSGKYLERRRDQRARKSDAIFWRRKGDADSQMGWLLEASENGIAFAWRGTTAPAVGSFIEIQREVAASRRAPEQAIIRRAVRAHDDLMVIAAETLPDDGRRNKPAQFADIQLKPLARRKRRETRKQGMSVGTRHES